MSTIRINENTATVTKDFLKKSKIFGTPEFFKSIELKKQYGITEFKTKTKSNNKTKNNKSAEDSNLTQKNMIKFIKSLDNSKKYLDEMETIKQRSKVQDNPKQYIIDWFKTTFPKYTEVPTSNDADNASDKDNIIPMQSTAVNE